MQVIDLAEFRVASSIGRPPLAIMQSPCYVYATPQRHLAAIRRINRAGEMRRWLAKRETASKKRIVHFYRTGTGIFPHISLYRSFSI